MKFIIKKKKKNKSSSHTVKLVKWLIFSGLSVATKVKTLKKP